MQCTEQLGEEKLHLLRPHHNPALQIFLVQLTLNHLMLSLNFRKRTKCTQSIGEQLKHTLFLALTFFFIPFSEPIDSSERNSAGGIARQERICKTRQFVLKKVLSLHLIHEVLLLNQL